MSKTTNYEISKKLAEIGFKAETSTSMSMLETKDYPSYDLETLLDALPDTIGGCLMIYKEGMYYQESMVEVQKQKNESLADTAGRLIIELYENNLIKF
jgi:hypothetical protein